MRTHHTDVVIVGAGNAGLTAALAAHEAGAKVVVLEAAPHAERGGNSRFSGGIFRTQQGGLEELKAVLHESNEKWLSRGVEVGEYSHEDYLADWQKTSKGRADEALMRLTIDRSFETVKWMHAHGVQWELTADKIWNPDNVREGEPLVLSPGGALRSLHEGVGLSERLFLAAEAKDGIEVWYESPAANLITEGTKVLGVEVHTDEDVVQVYGRVVLASGGFQANPEMRRRYLGKGWDVVKVRGTRFNMGTMLERALDAGAQPAGNWGGAHAVPIDAAAPKVGDLRVTDKMSRYSYTYALMVNVRGQRFVDEGEDHVWLTYAKTGWAVSAEEQGLAFQIFDQKSLHLLEPRYSTGIPIVANTLEELAGKLGVPAREFLQTVRDFNAAVSADANERFDEAQPDGVSARPDGQPAKSNWARTIEAGPFVAYPVTCGITFTYGGVKVDTSARIISKVGKPLTDIWATGEIVGDCFYFNYPAGAGLMRGAVLGRIAGTNAARAALADEALVKEAAGANA